MTSRATSLVACFALVACSSALPPRYVIEHDIDGLFYRRYQKTLDVELAIPGNEATGHTATYFRHSHGKQIAVATAFVTVYAHAASLAAEVDERLKALERYKLSVEKLEGGYVFMLDGGPSERWALWVSGRYLVKLGAPSGEGIPEELADAYMDLYPSDLEEHGHARKDAASAGLSAHEKQEAEEDKAPEREVPHYLEENAPK